MTQFQTDYEQLIYGILPDLNTIMWNNDGQNNRIAFVDGKWVFRFPKYEKPAKELVKEVNFLNRYGRYLGITVPIPTKANLKSENGMMYSLYRQIYGVPLSKARERISNQKDLAIELAQFLNSLHQLPIDEQLISILGEPEDPFVEWSDMFKRIEKHLFSYMRLNAIEQVKQLFNDLLTSLSDISFKPAVIHGDFGISNIIIDPDRGRTAGIIDFGSVVISDPAYDIASLLAVGNRGMGENFILLMEETYPELGSQLKRAKLYTSTFALQEALFGAENNDKRAFEAGMADYI